MNNNDANVKNGPLPNVPSKRGPSSKENPEEKKDLSQTKKIKVNGEKNDNQVKFVTEFVKKEDIKTPEVRHEVAYGKLPYDLSRPVARIGEPARTYPFTLDPFQDKAIACIERGESVLVSAHTSAGKTVIAEYAIAQSLKNKQRVIYTSPIKALSNQKYRELQHDFKDVGLMTGDVTLNPSSSCLVMTTEILRSMLYRGSEVLREVAWVIFDEIHYMRDKTRGVVWEETIILIPRNVRFVFLSATIPNALEFADWILYTDLRPTPLQHYVFPDGADGIFLVVDENGCFREDNFQKAISFLENKQDPTNLRNKKIISEHTNVFKLVKTLMVKKLNPVIAFAFSKKQCENLARQMSTMDFNSELIKKVIDNALSVLTEEDRDLSWFRNLLPLLQRGIGVHHSGLIPFMKEVVELLFQEGLIKVLFATETFAMGLNMPAKTVVFCELSKFDGIKPRNITSGEYIQMSGRAGRRGLDPRGFVVMNVDRNISPKDLQDMFKGDADHLTSAFHLKYHMILNMTRIEGISPELMLEHSFYQFQKKSAVPHLKEELWKLENECSKFNIPNEETVSRYHQLLLLNDDYGKRLRDIIFQPKNCLPYLQLGRLVKVKINDTDFGWGVIVRYEERKKRNPPQYSLRSQKIEKNEEPQYKIRVLLKVTADSYVSYDGREIDIKPCPPGQPGNCSVIPVDLDNLQVLSQYRFHPDDNLEHDVAQRQVTYKGVQDLIKQHPDGEPMEPINQMNIKDEKANDIIQKLEMIRAQLESNPTANDPAIYDTYKKKLDIQEKIRTAQKKIRNTELTLHFDELKKRKRLLRRLGYLTQNDVVEFKGRVACEITSGDELVLTELLLNGIFNDLTPQKSAALLSCFVCDEASQKDQPTPLSEEFAVLYRHVQETARSIAELTEECNIPIEKDVYLASFSSDLMDGVFNWCNNMSFKEICSRINMFEGNIVRNFRSLDELLRAMISAAKIIGTYELECKFSESREKLRRGIVFAASLYL
ncbi:4716_t:CDS:10 [Diversispora eburnea]|uniref:4716_t:CDS:1 n=3 Tax=Diversisporales TaxID=214509 RepID=A0A9N8YJL6_9GLOM|nr:4716_t:CDS:10 [Diversispora eburnea]